MSDLHKVFISYHHALDENYRTSFEERIGRLGRAFISGAVRLGDIPGDINTEAVRQKIRDDYLRDSSVTVVLIGVATWQRKHVDWEIGMSIRHTPANPRSGLIGILLPSYFTRNAAVNRNTIPPRLADNLDNKFASLHHWSENPVEVQQWIHDAYLRKSKIDPNNGRVYFAENRSGASWQ